MAFFLTPDEVLSCSGHLGLVTSFHTRWHVYAIVTQCQRNSVISSPPDVVVVSFVCPRELVSFFPPTDVIIVLRS